MPAKDDGSDKEKCLDLFLKIGLDERTAKNTVANNKVTANLTAVIYEVSLSIAWRFSIQQSINLSIFGFSHWIVYISFIPSLY